MKQTAVEWLINEIIKHDKSFVEFYGAEISQAKEMEKEQMKEFGSRITGRWGLTKVEEKYIEDEYNKTFKSE